MRWWRDVLLVQSRAIEHVTHLNGQDRTAIESVAARLPGRSALAAAGQVQQALFDLETNVNPRLVLDLLLLRFPRPT